MARKSKTDSAETVEKIVAATHTVLEREGVDAISFRKVAREAGMSIGTVSYYFTTADSLWEACLDAHYERVQKFALRYLADLESEKPAEQTLRAAARAGYYFALGERTALRLVLALASRRGGLTDRHQQNRVATLRGIAARWSPNDAQKDLVLGLQSVVYACTRYACSSVAERLAVTGASTEEAADERIADHLASSAVLLLLE